MKIKPDDRSGFLQIRALVAVLLFGAAICLAKFSFAPSQAAKGERERGEVDRLGRYMPVPGGTADDLNRLEEEWNNRLTYPTGIFNPAWVRLAAVQDSAITSAIPAGVPLKNLNQTNAPLALNSSSFTALSYRPVSTSESPTYFSTLELEGSRDSACSRGATASV